MIGNQLGFHQICWRGITTIEVLQVMEGISDAETVCCLPTTLKANVDGLSHGQAGRIPIGGERIGGHGDPGPAHAHGTRA